jgi:pimeloyl-ACP methyl ester carboxylesterase
MTSDVIALMDHLSIQRADLIGYSMGARLSLLLLSHYPQRFVAAVLGGIGWDSGDRSAIYEQIARMLDSSASSGPADPLIEQFRTFYKQRGSDVRALAACMRGDRPSPTVAQLGQLRVPVLLVVGAHDTRIAEPGLLVAHIPGAELLAIEGQDHLSTIRDDRYKQASLRFLNRSPQFSGNTKCRIP